MRSPVAKNINILWSGISMGCNYKIVASTLNNPICIIEKNSELILLVNLLPLGKIYSDFVTIS